MVLESAAKSSTSALQTRTATAYYKNEHSSQSSFLFSQLYNKCVQNIQVCLWSTKAQYSGKIIQINYVYQSATIAHSPVCMQQRLYFFWTFHYCLKHHPSTFRNKEFLHSVLTHRVQTPKHLKKVILLPYKTIKVLALHNTYTLIAMNCNA